MSSGIVKNLQKLLNIQKARVQQLEVELYQIKQSKACLEDDFFHAITQLQLVKSQQK